MANQFWIFVVVIILCVIAFFAWFKRERFLFWPIPISKDISGGKWVEIGDGIAGYLLPRVQNSLGNETPHRPKTLILYSHGNGGNLTWYTNTLYLLKNFGDVLAYDYSGYGRSNGSCTEKEVLNSGLAAYDYAVTLGYKQVVCYGFSMGGSISVNIASQRNPDGLILQGTFSRISDCIPGFVQFLIKDFFRSVENANSINCPVVMLHSLKDEVVPYDSSKELYDMIKSRKKFINLEGGHNTAVLNKEIFSEAFTFLEPI
jgi:pimeloyl-ACP methyl ester carboxylesterase